MRTEKSLKNIKYSLLGQFFALIIAFLSRFFFLKFLNVTYLGINGLFTNVLSILSFIELGIGPSLTFALYEPLRNKDTEKIKSLMNFFKKCYTIIGILVLIFGTMLVPFLPKLITNLPTDISDINLIYWLFVLNSSISYFASYKRTLLMSNQESYINNILHYTCYFIMNVIQIFVLWISKNFMFYLIVQILFTIIENILVTNYVNKNYTYLNDKNVKKIDKKTITSIKKNVSAMVLHKFGSIVVNATDNLILSKYIGLSAVGLYSNYYLIISNVQKIIRQIFNSAIASVGNLGAEGNQEKLIDIFKKINFINFSIISTCSIGLIVLLQDFIKIWLGNEYLFEQKIVVVLVVCFYFTGMRISVLLFKDALGLYWQDRYKAFFEAVINVVFSILLAKKLGVIGVFIGTLLSNLLTCFWVEPYVLFKYGIKKGLKDYFKTFFNNLFVAFIIGIICFYICNIINLSPILNIIIKGVITLVFIIICYYLIYRHSDNYKYIKDILSKIISKKNRKKEKK